MTHLEIVPYAGKSQITTDAIEVHINPEFAKYALALAQKAKKQVKPISSESDLKLANDIQGEINAALKQVEAARTLAKAPVLSLGRRIDQEADNVSYDLEQEKARIEGIHAAYTAQEENRRQAAIREAHEKKRREVELENERLLQIQAAKEKALFEARNATDLEESARLRRKASELEEKEADQAFDLSVVKQATVIEPVFNAPLVRGGSTTTRTEFVLFDPEKFFTNCPVEFLLRFAKVDLRLTELKSFADVQLMKRRDDKSYDEVQAFEEWGIMIKRYSKTTIKASAKVVS